MLLKNKFNSFIRFEFSPCHVNQHDPIPEFHQPKGRILSSSRGSYPQTSSWWSIYTSVTKRKKKNNSWNENESITLGHIMHKLSDIQSSWSFVIRSTWEIDETWLLH